MAQEDYTVANSDGATVRADINSTFQAGQTQNSGATAPSTTFAFQLWADTATDLLKQRNAGNSAWITLFKLSTGELIVGADVASAGALPVVADGRFADVTGTTTITSLAALGVGAVKYLQFDGIVTVTHHSTDLVLPGGRNITTVAGQILGFYEYAAGDWRLMFNSQPERKPVELIISGPTTDAVTGDAQIHFTIPLALNGMNLVSIRTDVVTAGTTGTQDIQIHNITQAADMLTTKSTIDSGETSSATAATPAVIDTSNDDVATGDRLRVDVDAIHTTAAKGPSVLLEFALP
jgi:hypothetical protein